MAAAAAASTAGREAGPVPPMIVDRFSLHVVNACVASAAAIAVNLRYKIGAKSVLFWCRRRRRFTEDERFPLLSLTGRKVLLSFALFQST